VIESQQPEPNAEVNADSNPALASLTPDDIDILTFCVQHWNLHGTLPSLDRAAELGLNKKKYHNTLLKEAFQNALSEQGIVLRSAKDGFKARTLTAEQLAAANTLLDLADTRSQKKKLQDLGISTVKYNSWLKDPVFKDYLMQRAENTLGDHGHEANLALLDAVRSGNIQAIAYYNEMTGKFVPESKRGATKSAQVDVQGIIVSIIEIIQQEVTDLPTQEAIGKRLMNLIQATQMANALTTAATPQEQQALPAKKQAVKIENPLGEGFTL
jgi:hypothetical protein